MYSSVLVAIRAGSQLGVDAVDVVLHRPGLDVEGTGYGGVGTGAGHQCEDLQLPFREVFKGRFLHAAGSGRQHLHHPGLGRR